MKKNLSQVDRVVRIFTGAVILLVAVELQSWWGLVGLVLILTGLVGYCGLYSLCGRDGCNTTVPKQPEMQAKDPLSKE